MFWSVDPERPRIWLMLAPMLAVVFLLFGGGLFFALIQSFGYLPLIGQTGFSLAAYAAVLRQSSFLASLLLTLYIAVTSTLIATALAVAVALAIRATTRGRQALSFIFQFNLPIPHLVGAVAVADVLSQSGLLARVAAAFGLIDDPGQFPVLVFDRAGVGIIAEYVWKETAFIGVTTLAVLHAIGPEYEELARSLGANRWQRFRLVLLPLMLPGVLAASVIAFAFSFGAFEAPYLLGASYPQVLPVLAYKRYTAVDLAARAEAMALCVIITLVAGAAIVAYLHVSRRYLRREAD
ncbi:MAG: ABC transporter permease subunit [Chloroflexaceae bacterium]|nr:ABC transporter permease subunit [Chloroflexaceae bacterium]